MICEYEHQKKRLTIPNCGTVFLNDDVVVQLFGDENLKFLELHGGGPTSVSLRLKLLFPDVAHQP